MMPQEEQNNFFGNEEYKFHGIFHDENYKYYVEEFTLAFKAIVR